MIQETQNDALKYIQGGLNKKIDHLYDGMTPQEAYEAGIRMEMHKKFSVWMAC